MCAAPLTNVQREMDFFDDGFGLARVGVRDLLQLEREPNVDDFTEIVRKILDLYGLRNAVYYCPTFQGRAQDDPFLILTYDLGWKSHYIRSNYQFVDPVVNTGARSLLPVDWAGLDRSNPKVVKLFSESREAGVGSQGLTIPIRGPANGTWALFSVTSNDSDVEWRGHRRQILADLVMTAHFLHQKAYELHNTRESIDLNAITRRETEALAWTAEGKSVVDIAVLMKISAETVKAHLDSARFKLGALNRVHAVTKAIRHGIIS
jgi:LuxR family quorum-sensing system transcriptional regulator SinR